MKKVAFYLLILSLTIPMKVSARNDEVIVTLSKCTDGDTAVFVHNDVKMNVRFLAVDTPETKHPTKGSEPFGQEASDYTCNALKNAEEIKLEFDSSADEIDKYSRYLAWIFVDNELLQKNLISNGLAKVAYIYGDYKYTKILEDEEKIAKEKQLGIWGDYKENKDYTLYYVGGFLLIVMILSFIRKRTKNKEIKNIALKTGNQFNKELKKLIKKI